MGIRFHSGSGLVFRAIAYQAHSQTACGLNLDQANEALAAYLGYTSYAAFLASTEETPDFEGVKHFVPDLALLRKRLRDLGHPESGGKVGYMAQVFAQVFAATFPSAAIYADATDLRDEAMGAIEAAIEHSGDYSSEQASTNAYGGEFDLELEAVVALEEPGDSWVIDVSGTSNLHQDPEQVYHGDVLKIQARAVFPKVGRRMLGEMEVQDIQVSVKTEPSEDEDLA